MCMENIEVVDILDDAAFNVEEAIYTLSLLKDYPDLIEDLDNILRDIKAELERYTILAQQDYDREREQERLSYETATM